MDLPAPARLMVVGATRDAVDGLEVYRRTPAVDVRVSVRREPDGALLVPAGELVLLWRDDGLRSAGLRLAPAQRVTLDLGRR